MEKLSYLVLLIVGSLFFTNPLAAQSDSVAIDLTESRIYRPNFALKWDFFSLISITPSLQFAAEFKTKQHQAFQVEGGYVFNYKSLGSRTKFSGFKSKLEYRFYHRGINRPANNFFWGFQYANRFIATPQRDFVLDQSGNYQRVARYNVRSMNNFLYVMGGFVAKSSGPQYFEMSMGLGYRNLTISTSKLPEGIEVTQVPLNGWFGNSRLGTYSYATLFFSAKWTFWSKHKNS